MIWPFNKIQWRRHCPDTQLILDKLTSLETQLCRLTDEVRKMTTKNTSLDQAVTDLDTAATAKIAQDQVLNTEALQGKNEAADVAKVEAIVDKLNAETAAEKVADTTTENVTVTGATPTGQAVPEAPVDTSAAAPTTQSVEVNGDGSPVAQD